MAERYWNSSRPKFKGETVEHMQSKEKIAGLLRTKNYRQIQFEFETPPIEYRGRLQPFPVDLKAFNRETLNTILCNLDGGYHYAGKYRGKSKNRDQSLMAYAHQKEMYNKCSYVVLDVEDVLSQKDEWILSEIWLQILKQHAHPRTAPEKLLQRE